MAELLLINPRRRARRAGAKRRPVRAAAKRRVTRRRRNPVVLARHSPVRRRRAGVARRRNPIHARRRRNPIRLRGLSTNGILGMLKSAFIGGAGALGVNYLQGSVINPLLPVSMQTSPLSVGAGDAVKAGLTILLGHFLDKPTKGLARQMATGALTVQAYEVLVKSTGLGTSAGLAGLGWATPARVVRSTARVGPAVRSGVPNVGAFMGPSGSPLLNAFQRPGSRSPLLSNSKRIMDKEGVLYR